MKLKKIIWKKGQKNDLLKNEIGKKNSFKKEKNDSSRPGLTY
jgi:hypothetical protein